MVYMPSGKGGGMDFCYVTSGGGEGVKVSVTLSYKGGEGGVEISPKSGLRNGWMFPYLKVVLNSVFDSK